MHHAGRRDQQFARGDEFEELLGMAVADHIIRLAVDQQHRTSHLSDQLAVGIPETDAWIAVCKGVFARLPRKKMLFAWEYMNEIQMMSQHGIWGDPIFRQT